MIKTFTLNKKGKIELSKDELKTLLDEVYNEGYQNGNKTWIYTTPYPTATPTWWTCTTTASTSTDDMKVTYNTSSNLDSYNCVN